MYRIIKTDGEELGVTDSIHYIRMGTNGCFIQTDRASAVGVAYKSVPYNLSGHAEIAGADDVIILEIDSGTLFDEFKAEYEFLKAQVNELHQKLDEFIAK